MGAGQTTLVVIGASAGGVEALTRLVDDLPADLDAAIVIVLHVPASGTSVLPAILDRHSRLQVMAAAEGSPLLPGRVYVAPPDNHVLVRDERLALDRGPKRDGHRPSIDALFETAARALRERVVGVILSGTLDDGTIGLGQVKLHGGCAVVQDPHDALYPNMPANAIERVAVDHVVPLAEMAALITRLAGEATSAEAVAEP